MFFACGYLRTSANVCVSAWVWHIAWSCARAGGRDKEALSADPVTLNYGVNEVPLSRTSTLTSSTWYLDVAAVGGGARRCGTGGETPDPDRVG
ncbi:unnamed protein product [Arctia plantaginis]|uniref:Uncharacterized protein n=1 Tax=Arctia plantaginis TaxID=874455 RepID=A0A8S0ZI48_ARCPL|nr:unnamed protein product [Arctia plantaginis]CAB3237486.1 unnamed protein product [Arctia plantaginis]